MYKMKLDFLGNKINSGGLQKVMSVFATDDLNGKGKSSEIFLNI